MAKKVYGLKTITMGDPAEDGGMGLTLIEILGATVKGTATLTSTEPTSEEIEIEESDELFDEIETKAAVWSFKASTYNVSKETMKLFFGGTITGTKWASSVGGNSIQVYKSVAVETRSGIKASFVKMKLTGVANLAFDKSKLGQIDWTGKLLMPDKADTPSQEWDFGV